MRELLRNRDFMLFWFSSVIASIAGMTLEFVVSLYAFDLTGSAALFGFILSIVIVPRLFLYPVAGVFADRYNRKKLLALASALVLFVLIVFCGWHFIFASLGVPHLFLLVIALEVFNIIFFTVSAVIPPMIVPSHQLGAANSFGILYSESGYLIGVLLGSFVYGALGFGISLLSVTVAFVLSLIFILLLRLPPLRPTPDTYDAQAAQDVRIAPPPHPAPESLPQPLLSPPVRRARQLSRFFDELREGAHEVVRDSLVLRLLIFAPLFNFLFMPLWDLVLLFFLRGELGMGVQSFGAFMALQSLTNVLAAFVAGKFYTDARALWAVRFSPCLLLFAMGLILLAALIAPVAPLGVIVGLSFVGSNLIAVGACFYVIAKNTFVQKRIPKQKQSRVFSLNRLTGLGIIPLGNFVFGLVVENFGAVAALVLITAITLGTFLVVWPLRPALLSTTAEPEGGTGDNPDGQGSQAEAN